MVCFSCHTYKQVLNIFRPYVKSLNRDPKSNSTHIIHTYNLIWMQRLGGYLPTYVVFHLACHLLFDFNFYFMLRFAQCTARYKWANVQICSITFKQVILTCLNDIELVCIDFSNLYYDCDFIIFFPFTLCTISICN